MPDTDFDLDKLTPDGVESWDNLFPFPDYREKQRQTMISVVQALHDPQYDNVIVDAPTGVGKCLTGDTLVSTGDGLVELQNVDESNRVVSNTDYGAFRYRNVRARFEKGVKETLRVTTERGYEIEGTPDHKLRVINDEGRFEWVRLGDMDTDQHVPLHRNKTSATSETVEKPPIDSRYDQKLPDEIEVDEDLAEFLGWFVADGNVDGNCARLTCHSDCEDQMFAMTDKTFSKITPTVGNYNNRNAVDINISSVEVVRLLKRLCYDENGNKTIPSILFQSPVDVRAKFLNGLFGGDGTVNHSNVALTTHYKDLARDLQQLLLSVGIVSTRNSRNSDYEQHTVRVSGSDLRTFESVVGSFYSESKHRLSDLTDKSENPNLNTVPNISGLISTVWEQFKETDHDVDLHRPSGWAKNLQPYRMDYADKQPSKAKLTDFLSKLDVESEEAGWLRTLTNIPVHFDRIVSIEESEAEVYDLNVPEDHNYVANGFISHNSAINVAACRSFGSSFYITPQKKLREQLQNDEVLSEYYKSLRSRRDYRCGVTGKDCETCDINKSSEKSCKKHEECTYWTNKLDAIDAETAVLTFAYLIVDGSIPPTDGDGSPISFANRDLLVVDECHGLESQVASLFAGFKVSPWTVPPDCYRDIARNLSMNASRHTEVMDIMETLMDRCEAFVHENKNKDDLTDQVEDAKKFINNAEWFFNEVEEADRDWVVDVDKTRHPDKNKKVRSFHLKPVKVDSFLQNFVWRRADTRLLTTATMPYRGNPDAWCYRIGLDPDRTRVIKVGMPFPAENRPIHVGTEIAKMSSGGDDEHWGEIMSELDRLAGKHDGENGLVHTASYKRAQRVYKDSESGKYPNLDANVLFHDADDDTPEFITKWQNSNKNVVVSPSMGEGVDLAGDMCRWQALLKVPYPNMGDSRVEYLMDSGTGHGADWAWYNETTANTIIQSVGRAVRSKDDKADYYVLDESFENVRKQVAFPDWFEAAITQSQDPLDY